MSTLHLYSCSHGKFGTTDESDPTAHQWSDNDCFGAIMSEHLGIRFENRSIPGASNWDIFSRVKSDLVNHKIDEDDIIFIRWSYISRKTIFGEKHTVLQAGDQRNDKKTKIYNEYFFLPKESMANMISYTFCILSWTDVPVYVTCSDDIQYLHNLDRHLTKRLIELEGWLDGPVLSEKDFFSCYHANADGHRKTAVCYLDQIAKKEETKAVKEHQGYF